MASSTVTPSQFSGVVSGTTPDVVGAERGHEARVVDGGDAVDLRDHRLAIRRSTRSSRDLNGSLHSTVRWAWSFSFRCTQSTV